jgi:hypothetical protein
MSDILIGPAYQPCFWAMGLAIYGVIVALVAAACGLSCGGIGYLLSRKSSRRVAGMRLPSFVALSTMFVVFSVICSTVCLWFFGPFAPLDDRLLAPSQPVSEEDIVGTWTLDAESLERMEQEGGYRISTHTLTFRDDGSFELVNMPDCLWFAGTSTGGFWSGSGTWGMEEYSGESRISVSYVTAQYEGGSGATLHIGGREPPYYIWTYAGNPDAGTVMVFEKR